MVGIDFLIACTMTVVSFSGAALIAARLTNAKANESSITQILMVISSIIALVIGVSFLSDAVSLKVMTRMKELPVCTAKP